MSTPPDNRPSADRPRASRAIKLVLMGVAGAALLYSCSGGMGTGTGFFPWLWFLGNPFARGPAVTAPATTATTPGTTQGQTQAQPSTRGGFGGSAAPHGSTATG